MDYENVIIDSIEILEGLMFRHEATSALSDEAFVEKIPDRKGFVFIPVGGPQ